jgi:hypothetical protein
MDGTTYFETQFKFAALLEYLLHALQQWSKTPWISEHTSAITIGARGLMAFFATIGIGWQYSGSAHTLLITGLSLTAIVTGTGHFVAQYAMQHAFGGLVRSGNLDKIKNIVEEVVMASALKIQMGNVNPPGPGVVPPGR